MKLFANIALCFVFGFSISTSYAGGDGSAGNGGTPLRLRKKLITEFIHTELRSVALEYLQSLDLSQIESLPARNAFKDMIARDLSGDIRKSSYSLPTSCVAIGGEVEGGAYPNDRGGEICLSPEGLARLAASKAEVVAHAIHEHAHHFGYPDTDDAIYKAAYLTLRLANPEWNGSLPATPNLGQAVLDPSTLGMQFVEIKAGTFWMGSPSNELSRWSNELRHRVDLHHSFEIQTTEVTQEQYIRVMGNNPSWHKKREHCPESYTQILGVPACPNYPVTVVSANNARLFVARINANLGQSARTHTGRPARFRYRLPTEAEWERAARGGEDSAYSFGGDATQAARFAWTAENSGGQPQAVASLQPNAYGLYDMHGNVSEWVEDVYDMDWYRKYSTSAVSDPKGPAFGLNRVVRGGDFGNLVGFARSAARLWRPSSDLSLQGGFRVVRTVE